MWALHDLGPLMGIAGAIAALLTGCDGSSASDTADAASDADAAQYEGCSEALPAFGVGLEANSEHGRIRASLLAASPSAPRKYENVWTLQLHDAKGNALDDADITEMRTFMPLHGHEGKPAAEAEMMRDEGQMVADLHFIMRGYWEVQIHLTSASAGDDYLMFPVCVGQ